MKSVFLVNPTAGKKSAVKKLTANISGYLSKTNEPYEIVETLSGEDATEKARKYAKSGEQIRIIACGGDGTAFRVLNGIAGYDNVIFGEIPCGTGNDFLKTVGLPENFADIENLMNGTVIKSDVIKADKYYCLNQASMGMDAAVCDNKEKFSNWPLVRGKTAYTLALIYSFLSKIRNQFKIKIDDQDEFEGSFLFAIGANGRFCGGGYKSAPDAFINNGKLDFVVVKSVSRIKVLSLLGKYTEGTHVDLPITKVVRGSKMTVTATGETPVNLDGEVIRRKSITFEVVPQFINLLVPKNLAAKFEKDNEQS